MRWCDVHAGPVTAKYPGRVGMCGGLVVVVACGQRANGFIKRRRKIDRHSGQVDGHRVGGDRYLVPGQRGNVFCALREDDDQDRGEPVAGVKRLLVSDLFDDGVLLRDGHPWCGPAAMRCHFQIKGDEPGLDGPPDKTDDVLAGGGAGRLPQIDVGLAELLEW